MAQLLEERHNEEVKETSKADSFPRIDGLERVSGKARYAADWRVPGMLHAAIIQSSIPHGIVQSVDTSKALEMEGVKGAITCLEDFTLWIPGERIHKRRVFADHVRFVGDCVGAIAATSRRAALEAVESVSVSYKELPAVFDPLEAMKPKAPKIWDEGNVIGPLKYGFGDAAASFARAERIFEREYSTSRVHNTPLEPAASLAWWDDDLKHLTVVAATQAITTCQESIAADLGLKLEDVRVISLYKGGGFGNKNRSMNYDLVAALLARRTKKPVMIEYTREQDFTGVHGRWASIQRMRAAVSGARILSVELKGYCDIGAYTRHIKQGNFLDGAEDYYSCESWSSEIYGIYTNTPVTAHMRAPSGPQACFASETLSDEIAHELSIDPLDFRLRNAIEKYHASEDFVSNSLKDCLETGASKFGWRKRWRRPMQNDNLAANSQKKKLVGVGLAMTSWHSSIGKGEAVVKLKRDGTLEVYVGVVDIGTGAKTTMGAIAAKELGMEDLESVKVIWGDTDTCPFSIGESGSRTTTFTGTAVREAASKLREKVLALASKHFVVSDLADLEISTGGYVRQRSAAGRGLVSFSKLLELEGTEELVEHYLSEPTLPHGKERYSFAAHFAEVEVDVESGQVNVSGYLACHDSGEIVNRLTAESQVQGATVMGIGMALSEQVLIDPNYGSMQNSSLLNYRLPNHVMIPKIEVVFLDKNDDPYGPKSLGEIGIIPVPAAIGNAIFNATGVRFRSLPFTPEKILNGIEEDQRRRRGA
jgi:CO/xanthine dehydrogenase Mo-binding subunit